MNNIEDLFLLLINYSEIFCCIIILIFGTIIIYLKFLNNKIKKEHAKEIINQKNFFVETLKHDISVPTIAQLRGIELLKKNLCQIKNEQKEILDEIEKSCIESLDIIQMLLLGKYSENYNIQPEIFDFVELINECLYELTEQTKNKNLKIFTNAKLNYYFVNADKIYIKKVLYNLIISAIVNAKKNETIYIETKLKKHKILLCIKSNNNYLSKYNTVGEKIKMTFCKKIIEDNHGSINNFSNKSFGFEIPRARCGCI